MVFQIFQKIIVAGSTLFLVSGQFIGLKAEDISSANSPELAYRELSKPFSIDGSNRLLVSLEKYLGKQDLDSSKKRVLKLVSAGKPLLLKDSKGLVHKSSRIKIIWREFQLKSSINYVRQVVGPFSSYESALRISNFLKEDGIDNVIAHPSDWEIWISKEISLPKELKAKIFRKEVLSEIRPVLKVGSSEYVLSGNLSITASDGMIWKKGIYKGPFVLKPDAYGTWTLLENVSLENYLLGVSVSYTHLRAHET